MSDDEQKLNERQRIAAEAARDTELVKRVGQGDERALGELYDLHSTTVFSIAMSILKDPGRAEEVSHDVFITLWTQPDRYNPNIGRFAPWFYRVARNRSIDVIRRRRREVHPSEPAIFELTMPDTNPGPDEATVALSEAKRVRQALTELPDNQRQLIELAYFADMTQSQMSDKLDIPLGTVKTRVRSGLQRLREILE